MTAIRFLADHDLNEHIIDGVRRREPAIEFLRVRDLGLHTRSDAEILDYANREQLVVVSHDVDTMTAAAAARLAESLGIAGLLMVPQSSSVSAVIDSLQMIWSVTETSDWHNQVVFLPL